MLDTVNASHTKKNILVKIQNQNSYARGFVFMLKLVLYRTWFWGANKMVNKLAPHSLTRHL